MSVHIFRKNRDRRFVDAVVTPGPCFDADFTEKQNKNRPDNEKTHIYPNKNPGQWPKDRPHCRYFIDCSCDFSTAERCENSLEYILTTAEENNFSGIAIPARLFSPALTFRDLRKATAAFKAETLKVYIITDENFSPFTDRQLYRDIDSYINLNFEPDIFSSLPEEENWFDHISTRRDTGEDDYLNDVISVLRRNSGKDKPDKDAFQKKDEYSDKQKPVYTPSLEEYISTQDESFADMLFHLIDEKGLTDVQAYKGANVNRRTFSKIRTDRNYHPSKKTVLAFCISLQLNIDETSALLKSAGYALTHSSKMDLVVEYFIINQKYDIFEINDALYAFDQPLLGV